MTRAELYRQVFNAPGGRDVLADIASFVKQIPVADAGSAGQVIAHIQLQLNQAEKPAPTPKPDRMRASGGRIAHG